ncbi:PEGA domain-containing protein [Planctomycetota bacterium]
MKKLMLVFLTFICISVFAGETGHILVRCNDVLEIYLDGELKGTTAKGSGFPMRDVAVGKHTLKIEKEGYEPQIAKVTVEKGRVVTYYVKPFFNKAGVGERPKAEAARAGLTPEGAQLREELREFAKNELIKKAPITIQNFGSLDTANAKRIVYTSIQGGRVNTTWEEVDKMVLQRFIGSCARGDKSEYDGKIILAGALLFYEGRGFIPTSRFGYFLSVYPQLWEKYRPAFPTINEPNPNFGSISIKAKEKENHSLEVTVKALQKMEIVLINNKNVRKYRPLVKLKYNTLEARLCKGKRISNEGVTMLVENGHFTDNVAVNKGTRISTETFKIFPDITEPGTYWITVSIINENDCRGHRNFKIGIK